MCVYVCVCVCVCVYVCVYTGKSDGTRGLITDGQALVDDFVQFATHVYSLESNSTLPIALLAHSLGTLIAILSVNKILSAGVPLAAVLFSGSALVAGPASSSPFGCQCLYPLTHPLTQTAVGRCMTSCLASCDPKGPAAPILIDGMYVSLCVCVMCVCVCAFFLLCVCVSVAISSDQYQRELVASDPLQYHGDIMNKTAQQVSE